MHCLATPTSMSRRFLVFRVTIEILKLTRALPKLCASGTLGVAAVGFALGHPQHSTAARPTSKKRRMPSRVSLRDSRSLQDMPTTPARPSQPASAPTSRLQKRASVGRPLTSSGSSRGGIKTLSSTPETKLNHGHGNGAGGHPSLQASGQPFGHGPFTFESKGSENTPPSWLRRISTMSSLKNGSPEPTPRPGSPSISYSNGSTAPMLSNLAEPSPATSSRNKLVKRSSSQRLLHSSKKSHSTLRRPATSHQRSATFQQQFRQEEDPGRPSLAASSILPYRTLGDEESNDKDPQVWLPSFKAHSRNANSRKRHATGSIYRNETIRTIVPNMTEVTTLLMATSLSPDSSDDVSNSRASNLSRLSRPFTSAGVETYISRRVDDNGAEDADISELKPRNSFSLSDMFPSPSPSTWKMPRTSSVKRSRPFLRDSDSRRVVSAPQPNGHRKPTCAAQSQGELRQASTTDINAKKPTIYPSARRESSELQQESPSSPLPPLKRLSSFEIRLPSTIPSYPTTPQLENSNFSQDPSTHSSKWVSPPLGFGTSRIRAHRISSAISEPGSTLLGSDNDNSRLMSGDEDELDSRSETIYDSTRTGATGSSQSGIRRPPIDTIFDESPPPEMPSKRKLIDLHDLVYHNDSFLEAPPGNQHREEELDVSTPMRDPVSYKENDSPTPMPDMSEIVLSSEPPFSSPQVPIETKTPDQSARNSDPDQDDELWAFEHAEISHAEAVHIRNVSLSGSSNPLLASSPSDEVPQRRHSPPAVAASENPSKTNIFKWSEQSHVERDSPQGGSPRPRTVHGRQGKDVRGSHVNGRRGPSALHLRSQSVPVQKDLANRRNHNNPSALDSWILGNKGPSEDWDGDFEFEEAPRPSKQVPSSSDPARPSLSSGMLVPRTILERQASVHGQFGQVKELALLVEDLKRLQQQAAGQGIMQGQSVELWKEAEGIINLATLDDEDQEIFPPRSPHSPSFDFDTFDEDSPSIRSRRKSVIPPPKEESISAVNDSPLSQLSSRPSQDLSSVDTPTRPTSRTRKDSSAKAKSVLETIHQQRNHYDAALLDAPFAQKKLPFDTTSLKDLVTRAGVVTRALKEIVRRAEQGPETPEPRSSTPRDPPYISQMFHHPPVSPSPTKSPRVTKSPKSPRSPKSQRSGTFITDNEINGHMKMMTVV